MTDVLVVDPRLYSDPAVNCAYGARVVHKAISVTAAQEAITNYFAAMILPAGHKLMDFRAESTDLDTGGPSVTISFGILNTYANEKAAGSTVTATSPVAAYGPAGRDTYTATNTGTAPAIVSGQEILTSSTICQGGTMARTDLAITKNIGVDYTRDRIICFYFPVAPTTPAAGTVHLIATIDAA